MLVLPTVKVEEVGHERPSMLSNTSLVYDSNLSKLQEKQFDSIQRFSMHTLVNATRNF